MSSSPHEPYEDDMGADLADVLDDLREAFLIPVDPVDAERQLQLLLASAVPRKRSRRRLAFVAGTGVAGVMIATSGLAAAGVLPEPIQNAVSTIFSPLGIHVPDGSSLRPSSPDGNGTQTGQGGGGTSDQTPSSGRSDDTRPGSTLIPAPDGSGHSDEAPGQGGENPGNSDAAPGQQKEPGNSENAPGHGGENPGQSQDAPGHGGQNPGNAGGNGNAPPSTTPPTTPRTPPSTQRTPPTTPHAQPSPPTTAKAKADNGVSGKK